MFRYILQNYGAAIRYKRISGKYRISLKKGKNGSDEFEPNQFVQTLQIGSVHSDYLNTLIPFIQKIYSYMSRIVMNVIFNGSYFTFRTASEYSITPFV